MIPFVHLCALYLTIISSSLYTAANMRGWVNPRMRADCSHSQVLVAANGERVPVPPTVAAEGIRQAKLAPSETWILKQNTGFLE